MENITPFFRIIKGIINLKCFIISLLIGLIPIIGNSQTLLAGWDFQTTTSSGTAAVASPSTPTLFNSNVGSGTLYLNGSNGSSSWLQATELNAFSGTATNAGGPTGLSTVTTGPASLALLGGSSNSANGKSIVFKISMSGFKNLIVSYATQKSSTGFNNQLWEYSSDGLTWVNIGTAINPPTSFGTAIQTLTTIAALDNAVNAFIRLTVSGSSGTSQNNRLDNIQFNATSIATPTITGSATATAFTSTYGTPSAAQAFAVSGTALTANLVATAPTGFEVSSDGTTYASTASFTPASGTASGSLRIRLAANAAVAGSYNAQNIVLSSTGATAVNITTAASGNSVTAKALTITGVTANNKNFDANNSATLSGIPTYVGLANGETFAVIGTPVATFNTAAAGVNKPVTVSGYTEPSTNYTVSQPLGLTATIFNLSSASDVIAVAGSEAVSISSLINDNAPLTNATSAQVWQITVRDGGAAPDSDSLPTKVNGITISRSLTSSAIDFSSTIRTAALFDNAGTFIATASSITSNTIVFSSLGISVGDDSSATYTLRLSLQPVSAIPLTIDGKDIGLSIPNGNITAVNDGTSSTFSFTTAALTANNTNVIAVVATRLAFVQNANNTVVGSGMTPAVTLSANDANGNRDLNFVTPIAITSTGTLSGAPISATPAAGFATFAGLSHSVAGSGLVLTTTNSSGLSNVSSAPFNITTGPTILAAGDLAIIAVGTNTPDKIAFVLLKDINAGTVINFTDNAMASPTTGSATEGFLIYTAQANQCSGTVITWQNGQSVAGTGWDFSNPSGFALNNTGDNLFAFQGATANWASQTGITLLYGITTNSTWITTGSTSAQTSYSPASLNNLYKVNFNGFSENDVFLTALSVSGTSAEIITNVTNTANYTKQNSSFAMPAYTSFTVASSVSTLSASPVCSGSVPTINISSANIDAGTYTVTYSLSGTNTASNATATMVFVSGSGSFTIPVLANAGNTTITIIKINNGGCDKVLSPNTAVITVGGQSIYSAGTGWDVVPTAGREIIFDADYNLAANLSGCSCTVNAGKVVTIPSLSSMTLLNGITVDTTNPLTSLTFENTAPLVQINNVANTGKITVKRNSSALMRLDYTMWSSPVEGQNLLAFSPLTFNQGPSNIRFYTYDTSANYYKVTPPASTSFAYGTGYLIRMPDNHPITPTIWPGQFTGIPNNGSNTATISYISSTQAFNSIGNPYPSPINLYTAATGFMKVNAANIESTIYFWRKTNSNTANSGYCAYNNGILTVAGSSTFNGSDPNGVVQTGQGFLVVAKPGGTAVVFNNDMRVASAVNQFNRAIEAEHNTIWLNLTNDNNAAAQAAITYRPSGTDGIDDYDGLNLNDGQISIGSTVNNKNYIIQSRQFPFSETDVVPLIVKTNTSGIHTFAIDHLSGFFSNRTQPIYLKDKLFNVVTNLNTNNYTFAATAGTDNNRFEIVYQAVLSNPTTVFNENSVVVYKNNADFVVNAGNATISNVKIYDLQGRLLLIKSNINSSETRLNIGAANQMVIIKTTLVEGQIFSTKALN